jgi:xanthine dehydrogenase YagS FAD-binding subunit
MNTFQLSKATSAEQASQMASNAKTAQQGADIRFVAGGTSQIDLMKLNVDQPQRLIDINRIGLNQVETMPDGSVKIGALVRNSDLAHNTAIVRNYPVLSQALLSGASGQLRNMATTGGNLLQKTRCNYYRDTSYKECNKRSPGSGCAAIGGHNRNLGILGTSEHCIATHPSDMAVAMAALEAQIHIQGTKGERLVAIKDFYLLPGTTPHLETVLAPGDLITHVTLPPLRGGARSVYLKLRDRASYEFALASAAVVVDVDGSHIKRARIALGGVGSRPWRVEEAEQLLAGKPVDESHFRAAAEAALKHARPQSENGYKVELSKRCIVRALKLATTQNA